VLFILVCGKLFYSGYKEFLNKHLIIRNLPSQLVANGVIHLQSRNFPQNQVIRVEGEFQPRNIVGHQDANLEAKELRRKRQSAPPRIIS
jgi:hypothetical protein